MSVRIIDNTTTLEESITQKSNIFLRLAAEAIVAFSRNNTPMKTGDLRNRVTKQVLGLKGRITWGTNYAIYQEEKQFKNYTTPGTGPDFAKNAVSEIVNDAGQVMGQAGLI